MSNPSPNPQPNLSCNVSYTFKYKEYVHLAIRINTRCESKEMVEIDMSKDGVRFGDSVCRFVSNENGLFFVCRAAGKETQTSIPDCKYDKQDLYSSMTESDKYRHIFIVKCFGDIEV